MGQLTPGPLLDVPQAVCRQAPRRHPRAISVGHCRHTEKPYSTCVRMLDVPLAVQPEGRRHPTTSARAPGESRSSSRCAPSGSATVERLSRALRLPTSGPTQIRGRGRTSFEVPDVPKWFSKKGYVAVHERPRAREKPPCSMCPKRFNGRSDVLAHERTHTQRGSRTHAPFATSHSTPKPRQQARPDPHRVEAVAVHCLCKIIHLKVPCRQARTDARRGKAAPVLALLHAIHREGDGQRGRMTFWNLVKRGDFGSG